VDKLHLNRSTFELWKSNPLIILKELVIGNSMILATSGSYCFKGSIFQIYDCFRGCLCFRVFKGFKLRFISYAPGPGVNTAYFSSLGNYENL